MKLFGIASKSETEGAVELAEVTLVGSPNTLRAVARFLEWSAAQIEIHGSDFEHHHLQDFDESWQEEVDVITMRIGTDV